MSDLSTYLFARPSLLEGMGRTVDLWGTMTEYNQSLSPEQADYLAILSDWTAVGDDLRSVMREVGAAECDDRGQ